MITGVTMKIAAENTACFLTDDERAECRMQYEAYSSKKMFIA